MTRSIFDPSGDPEHGGDRFTPEEGIQISHLPDHFTHPPLVEEAGNVDFQPPAETPSIEVLAEDGGKLLLVHITGKLHKEDYERFVPTVEKAVREQGKIRMLVEMHHFHGWDAGGLWEDVKFDVKHFNDIERLAIVGESRWENLMASFCTAFTTATIRYFRSDKSAEARKWISEG